MGAHFLPTDRLRQAAWETRFRVLPLASEMGMDVRTLERRFEAELQMTPGNWIRRERIAVALPLLAAGLLNKEIADRLGYTRSANFGRDFKRVLGCTPRQYLRRMPVNRDVAF